MLLVEPDDLRVWLRIPADDFDTAAAELVLESAEMSVRSVVGHALDVIIEHTANYADTDLWRTASAVCLEHAATIMPNPEGVLQRNVYQAGSVSFADSRHSARDLTRGQKERLRSSIARSQSLVSVRLT